MKPGLTVVVKVGSASLVDPATLQPSPAVFRSVANLIATLRRAGHRAVLVSSGAAALGQGALKRPERPTDAAELRALAAVGQTKLMALWEEAFRTHRLLAAQVLVLNDEHLASGGDQTAAAAAAAATMSSLLQQEVVPVVNENDAVAPGTFGGNDILALVVAAVLQADVIAFLTDVDCLYTANPRLSSEAEAIEVVTDCDSLKVDVSSRGTAIGTGGMSTKVLTARLAAAMGITTIVNNVTSAQNVANVVHNVHRDVVRKSTPAPKGCTYTSFYHHHNCDVPVSCTRCPTSLHTIFLPGEKSEDASVDLDGLPTRPDKRGGRLQAVQDCMA